MLRKEEKGQASPMLQCRDVALIFTTGDASRPNPCTLETALEKIQAQQLVIDKLQNRLSEVTKLANSHHLKAIGKQIELHNKLKVHATTQTIQTFIPRRAATTSISSTTASVQEEPMDLSLPEIDFPPTLTPSNSEELQMVLDYAEAEGSRPSVPPLSKPNRFYGGYNHHVDHNYTWWDPKKHIEQLENQLASMRKKVHGLQQTCRRQEIYVKNLKAMVKHQSVEYNNKEREKEESAKNSGKDIGKKNSGKDIGKKNSGKDIGKKNSGKDIGKKNLGTDIGKKNSGKDIGKKNSGKDIGKKNLGKDIGKKNLGKDIGKKNLGKDIGKKNLGKDIRTKNSRKKDLGVNDPNENVGNKNSGTKDSGKKNSGTKDGGKKNSRTKDSGKKNSRKKDNGKKDPNKNLGDSGGGLINPPQATLMISEESTPLTACLVWSPPTPQIYYQLSTHTT